MMRELSTTSPGIRGARASASLKLVLGWPVYQALKKHPRRARLGLIEAGHFASVEPGSCGGIRGARASASLKLTQRVDLPLKIAGIRGARASASLKRVL